MFCLPLFSLKMPAFRKGSEFVIKHVENGNNVHCKYLKAYYRHPIGMFAYNRQTFVKFEGKMPTIFTYSWSFVLTGKFFSLSR